MFLLIFNNYRTSKTLILAMKHLSMKFKQATLLLLGTIILPFSIQAQNGDDAEGDGGGAGGGTTLVNAPVTSVNNSQSHMTNTTTSFSHPSEILNRVNVAA